MPVKVSLKRFFRCIECRFKEGWLYLLQKVKCNQRNSDWKKKKNKERVWGQTRSAGVYGVSYKSCGIHCLYNWHAHLILNLFDLNYLNFSRIQWIIKRFRGHVHVAMHLVTFYVLRLSVCINTGMLCLKSYRVISLIQWIHPTTTQLPSKFGKDYIGCPVTCDWFQFSIWPNTAGNQRPPVTRLCVCIVVVDCCSLT